VRGPAPFHARTPSSHQRASNCLEPDHARLRFIRQSRKSSEGILQVNSILIGQPIMQALKLFVTASDVPFHLGKRRRARSSAIRLIMAVAFVSVPAMAQEKNEVGLVIGGIVTPSQSLSPGASLIGPGGAVLPNRDISFDPA